MGPITLFDKSFLQSLSIDESVWFDHFSLAVIAPYFYVETLADLAKSQTAKGRTAEEQVRVVAEKFPEMSGSPCAYHVSIAVANLLGHDVPMKGFQIPMNGGRVVKSGDRIGLVYDHPEESKAFQRWQAGDFWEVEHQFASNWRASLSTLPIEEIANAFGKIGMGTGSARNLTEAKAIADAAVKNVEWTEPMLKLLFFFLGVPVTAQETIISRWRSLGGPPLASFAPYAAYVLTVEIFFQIAVASSLISAARPSNRIDIAYLFYLPFCMVFTSSDSLHKKCAPLFMRPDQTFVWGLDFKSDLAKLNAHFSLMQEELKEKSIMALDLKPPTDGNFVVAELWDKYMWKWRQTNTEVSQLDPSQEEQMLMDYRQLLETAEQPNAETVTEAVDPDVCVVKRIVRKRKGSWWQVPKEAGSDKS